MTATLPIYMSGKLEELNALCEEHPLTIPVSKAANFMGIDVENFRYHIAERRVPFAFGGDVGKLNRHFVVSTMAFYNWHMQCARIGIPSNP